MFFKLYDGLYIQYVTRIYDIKSNGYIEYNYIQKLNIETNSLQDAFDLGNLGIAFSSEFKIKNLDNCSYLIINKTFCKFSNNEFVKLSDEIAEAFATLTEDDWSFYTLEIIHLPASSVKPNNIYIYKVNQYGKEIVFNFSYYRLSYVYSTPSTLVLNNYLVVPMFFSNGILHIFRLGFLFMDLETNEIKAYKFPMDISVFSSFYYYQISENSLQYSYAESNESNSNSRKYILTIKE